VSQPSLTHVLQPKWRTAQQRLREARIRGGGGKLVLLLLVGGAFWAGVFGVLFRILKYFRGIEELGPLLGAKLLGVALLSFVSILILSNVITALSSFFLAKDLDLLVSTPVDWLRLYLAKLGETLVHSSWMVALMTVPILAAYGVVYRAGLFFIPYALAVLLPLLALPAVFGSAMTLILVNVFPARRTRDLLSIVALGAAAGVILLFRLIRPEQLARPEGFRNLLDFIAVLRTPTSPFLPSEWATKAIMGFLGLLESAWSVAMLPLAFTVGLMFGALGMSWTALSPSYAFFNYFFTLVLGLMFLFSGVFFPLDGLPRWAVTAAWFLPLTHAVVLMRALRTGDLEPGMWQDVAWIAVFTILAFALAVRLIRRRLIR